MLLPLDLFRGVYIVLNFDDDSSSMTSGEDNPFLSFLRMKRAI